MNQKFRYLGQRDREEIERMHNGRATVAVIADKMVEYTIGIMRDGGRPRRYLRIKSDSAIKIQDPVVTFTREQTDKRSVYECIIGDLIRTVKEEGFYYEWYELESVLVATDHTPPFAAGLEELAPSAAAAAIAFVTLAEAG